MKFGRQTPQQLRFTLQNPLAQTMSQNVNQSGKPGIGASMYAYNQPVVYKRNSTSNKNSNNKLRIQSRPISVKVKGEKIPMQQTNPKANLDDQGDNKQSGTKIKINLNKYGRGIEKGVQRGMHIDDQSMKTNGYQNFRKRPVSNGARINDHI